MEHQQGYRRIKQHCKPTRPNRHPTTTKDYTFFLTIHGTFSRLDRAMLGYKTILNKFTRLISHKVFYTTTWNEIRN